MTRNIQYWIDYWTSLFRGIEHRRLGPSLINPRVLLRELIEEIETRDLKNSENKRFLMNQISRYKKEDIPTKRCLHSVMRLICREFNKPRLEVITQLCKRGLDILDSLYYYDYAVDALRELLTAEEDVKSEQLCLLCQDIIVELLEAGYSLKYVEAIPRYLFSNLNEYGDIIETRFPHGLSLPTDPEDTDAIRDYETKLKLLMEELTDAGRIDALKSYPRMPRRDLRFIFQVRGVKGSLGFDIGPVHFYSPKKERVLNERYMSKEENHPELFSSGEYTYLNAVVVAPTHDIHSGAAIAKRKIVEAINCLSYEFGSKAHYDLGEGYIAVDENGQIVGESWGLDDRSGLLHWHNSLNLTREYATAIEESEILRTAAPHILASGTGSVEHRLMDSLHWFRKGKEAEAPEGEPGGRGCSLVT
jgi:hypothetical protein